jgi:hypothetical protein
MPEKRDASWIEDDLYEADVDCESVSSCSSTDRDTSPELSSSSYSSASILSYIFLGSSLRKPPIAHKKHSSIHSSASSSTNSVHGSTNNSRSNKRYRRQWIQSPVHPEINIYVTQLMTSSEYDAHMQTQSYNTLHTVSDVSSPEEDRTESEDESARNRLVQDYARAIQWFEQPHLVPWKSLEEHDTDCHAAVHDDTTPPMSSQTGVASSNNNNNTVPALIRASSWMESSLPSFIHRSKVSMELPEALCITSRPRILLEGFAPFAVVHTNAAFGAWQQDQQHQEQQDGNNISEPSSLCSALTRFLHASSVQKDEDAQPQVTVYPVWASGRHFITHYLVEVHDSNDNTETTTVSKEQPGRKAFSQAVG